MEITSAEIRSVARLARLALSDQELALISGQLADILKYFEEIASIDTSGVEPTSHVVPLSCPQREDRPGSSLAAEELLSRAPERSEGHFLVPPIIDQGS